MQTYLDESLPKAVRKYYQPYFNESGRGFPDISAHSTLPPYAVSTSLNFMIKD